MLISTVAKQRMAMSVCGLLLSFGLITPAVAQTTPPPRFEMVDDNGVDLVSGRYVYTIMEGAIGSGDGAVSLERSQGSDYGQTDQWSGRLYRRTVGGTALMYVTLGRISDTFTVSGSTYTATKANGGTLVYVGGSTGTYQYTASDGTVADYDSIVDEDPNFFPIAGTGCSLADAGTCAIPVSITRPNGTAFTLSYDFHTKCVGGYDSNLNCLNPAGYFRFKSVTSGASYRVSLTYTTDTPGSGSAPQANWYKRTGATFTNLANTPSSLPTVTYAYPSSNVIDVTDIGGRTWRFTSDTSARLTGIRRPGVSSDNVSVTYGTSGNVTQVIKDGITTTYSRSVSGTTGTMTITNALSQVTTIVSDLNIGRPTSVTDGISRTTSFTYDTNGRLTRVTFPEGNYINYTYDSRGNLTETRRVAKSGSGLSDIVTTASYASSCTNPVTCNSPQSTTDARGYTTDYTYDTDHGGLLSVTLPAPSSGAVRPQTRFGYALTNGEYRVTSVSQCQTTSSCSGDSDEVKTTIAYDANGNITSASAGNGNGTLTATTTATYDPLGDILTIDGPQSGTADTTRFRYNSARERIGTVGPDPDGTGSLTHRAERVTYNSEGLVTKVEKGTVNSQSDSDWAAFYPADTAETAYDSNGRATTAKLTSGSTTYALTQTSYDALGRIECTAQRMNPAEFASLPSSACSLDTEGDYGPDRIVKTVYDAAGQVTQTKSAYATSLEANDVTSTYTANGQIATVTDAEGNKTTYEYDGHDRMSKLRYPSTTAGAGTSSTTDYQEFSYDADSHLTAVRLRDGWSRTFSFDGAGRQTHDAIVEPGYGVREQTVSQYDALNRVTVVENAGGTHTFSYDALGRLTSEQRGSIGISSTWDVAGRRTRITWADGFYVDQDFLVTGETTKIRENGATSGYGVLATYAYDDLGRRTSLTRGDGSVLSYTYDDVSRLSQLVDNLSGADYDQTLGLSYNPAGQIAQATRSNDNYAWGGHYNVNRGYAANGLNQYTASGSITPTYDSRGNLTSAGSITYAYDRRNKIVGDSTGVTLDYDPTQRLYQVSGGSAGTRRMIYDGTDLVAEYNSSNVMVRRFVHGPGGDEPIVWYEGSGTTDRRFLHADERGSITAVTNSPGDVRSVNSYDEYGIPASANSGRFQYTGQVWVPELGMYNYKARIYSPTLGRFMQTDPIGYDDGMNLYAYVKNDPIGRVDQFGTDGSVTPPPVELPPIIVTGEPLCFDDQNYNEDTEECENNGTSFLPKEAPTPGVGGGGDGRTPSLPPTQNPCPPGTHPDMEHPDYEGTATEYGEDMNGNSDPRFVGQPTRSGEIYDPEKFTAASVRVRDEHGRSTRQALIPLGSHVIVTAAAYPNRAVGVKINDTGPLRTNRIIDLSPAAMKALTGKRHNKVEVKVFVCKPG